jgi:hypothetical protein
MTTLTLEENYDLVKEHYCVVLDSRLGDLYKNGSDNSDIVFIFPDPVVDKKDSVSLTCSILNFTCPNSQYVVTLQNNEMTFIVYTAGVPDTQILNIPVGNYNPQAFTTAFLAELTSAFGANDFTLTYSTTTYQLTISSATKPFDFYIFDPSLPIPSNIYMNERNTLGMIIGCDNHTLYSSNVGAGALNSVLLPYPVNFSGINSLNIHIANIQTRNINSLTKTNSNLVANIPVNCGPNEVIFFDKRNDFEFTLTDDVLNQLEINLKDNLGNFLELNNQYWNLVIEFIIIRKQFSEIKSFSQIINYESGAKI